MADPKAQVNLNDRAIKNYYNELAGGIKQGAGAQQAGYSQASSRVGTVYDEMTRALTDQANATSSGLADQFNMLGIGAATDSATNDLRGQLNQALISAARRKAAEQSGLTEQARAYRQAGLEAVTNAQREGTRTRSDARTSLMEAITNLQAAEAQAKGEMDLAKLQGEIQLAQMRQQMAARRGGGGGGRSGSPLDMLRAQLMGLEILEKQRDLEMGPDTPWNEGGQGGLNRFLSGSSDYWGQGGAGPKFRGELQNLIDYGYGQANSPRSIASGMKDPYTIAMGNLNSAPNFINQDALAQALQIYFGKY